MIDSDKERALRICRALGEIEAPLDRYAALLARWQSKMNLVGPSTLSSIWTRHFADSLQLARFAEVRGTWVDLGSGAGFPGLVVAILQRRIGAGAVHLVESDARKAAFLREVSRETGASAIVHNARSEIVLPDIPEVDVVTSRAMASLPKLLDQTRTLVEKGATCLFLKGQDVASELTAITRPSNFDVELFPSIVDQDSTVVRIRRREST